MRDILQKYIPLIFFPGLACVISCFFTLICIRVMPGLGFIVYPDGKHPHAKPVPNAGGFAIVISFILTMTIYGLLLQELDASYKFLQGVSGRIFLPAVFLCAVGLYADRTKLSIYLKIFGQILAGAAAWLLNARLTQVLGYQIPDVLSFFLTIIWIIAFINIFTAVTRMDGLGGGLGMVAASCLCVWFLFTKDPELAVLSLTLGGCCLGFLFFNFHPAKIYMGRTGSMFVGFAIAVCGIYTPAQSADKAAALSAVMIPLLAFGVPLFDVFIAIWLRASKRIFKKISKVPGFDTKIMGTEREHLHHRLLGRNHNQSRSALYLYLAGAIFAISATCLMFFPENGPIKGMPKNIYPALAVLVVLSAFIYVIRRLGAVEMWQSAGNIINGMRQPHRALLISMIHPFLDMFILIVSYLVAGRLFFYKYDVNSAFLITMISVPLLGLHLGRCYRVHWVRAGIHNYRILIETLVVAFIIGGFASYYLVPRTKLHVNFLAMYMFFSVLGLALILGERFLLRYIEAVMLKKIYLNRFTGTNVSRCVVYGAGDMCQLFLAYLSVKYIDHPMKVIGLIDEDPELKELQVHGHLVFGDSTMLEKIYQKHRFDRIVIAAGNMDLHNQRRIIEFCRLHNLYLCEFRMTQDILLQPEKTHKMKVHTMK